MGEGGIASLPSFFIYKMKNINIFLIILFICFSSCNERIRIDITPHALNPKADYFYKQSLNMLEFYDVDSTKKSLSLLDQAISIDSLNPDYYGMKAKLLSELGLLDSALYIQSEAEKRGAINGEYLFQLGLFQAAKDMKPESKESFKRSNEYLQAVLKKYPDSLGAFILQQAANSLYLEQDSLFMNDVKGIRERFPDRLMEVEMTRRLKPSTLIRQIKNIEIDAVYNLDFDLDSIVQEAERTGKRTIKVD